MQMMRSYLAVQEAYLTREYSHASVFVDVDLSAVRFILLWSKRHISHILLDLQGQSTDRFILTQSLGTYPRDGRYAISLSTSREKGDQPHPLYRAKSIDGTMPPTASGDYRLYHTRWKSVQRFRATGMKNFLSLALPGFSPSHRTTIRRRLAVLYAKYRQSLREVLPTIRWIALTTDIWRSPRYIHYICIKGHVFTDDFETVPVVFRRVSRCGRQPLPKTDSRRCRKIIYLFIRPAAEGEPICSVNQPPPPTTGSK